jgi:uncharacterized C2H2 Zn-finger protein
MASENNAVHLPTIMADSSWSRSNHDVINNKSDAASIDAITVVIHTEVAGDAPSTVFESSKSCVDNAANNCEHHTPKTASDSNSLVCVGGESTTDVYTNVCRTNVQNCIEPQAYVKDGQHDVNECKSDAPSSPVSEVSPVDQHLEASVKSVTLAEVESNLEKEVSCDISAEPLKAYVEFDTTGTRYNATDVTISDLGSLQSANCTSETIIATCEKDVDVHHGEQFQTDDSNVTDSVIQQGETDKVEASVSSDALQFNDSTGVVNAIDNVQHEITDDVLRNNTANVQHENTDNVQHINTDNVQHENTYNVQCENTNNVPQENTDFVQRETTDYVPQENTDNVQRETTKNVQHENTDNVPQENTDYVPQENTDNVQHETTKNVQHENTDYVPQENTDYVPHENVDNVQHENTINDSFAERANTNNLQYEDTCDILHHAAAVTKNQQSTVLQEHCESFIDTSVKHKAKTDSNIEALAASSASNNRTDVCIELASHQIGDAGIMLVNSADSLPEAARETVCESTVECTSVAEETAALPEEETTAKDAHENESAISTCSSEQIGEGCSSTLDSGANKNIVSIADDTMALAVSSVDVCESTNRMAAYQTEIQGNIEQGEQLPNNDVFNVERLGVSDNAETQMEGVSESVVGSSPVDIAIEGTSEQVQQLVSSGEDSLVIGGVNEQRVLSAVDHEAMDSSEALDFSTGRNAAPSEVRLVDDQVVVTKCDTALYVPLTNSDAASEVQVPASLRVDSGGGAYLFDSKMPSQANDNAELSAAEESCAVSSKMATAMSNLDLILQSVAHPSSPYADGPLKLGVLPSDKPAPSTINLLANFTSAATMAFSAMPIKRKRGRPKLVRDPPIIGPNGQLIEVPVKPKGKYVRKKPRNSMGVVGEGDNSALDLTMGSKSSQDNIGPTPPKRKYTKKAKIVSLEKSGMFDGFVRSQINCSTPTSLPLGSHSPWSQRFPSTSSAKDTDSESINDNFNAIKGDTSLNESFESTGSNDLSDDQRLTSIEGDVPNGSCSNTNSKVSNAFDNLRETILIHGERFYQCPVCTYVAKQKGNLRRHLQQHDIFQCSHCPFCATDNLRLDNHMKEVHPSRWGRRKCTKCSKFVRAEDQDEHLASCTGEQMDWPCEQCPKVFHYEGALKVHMKMHREEQPAKLVCGCCGKQYKYEAAMRSHLLTHGAENLVGVCTRCGTKCANDAELEEHLKTHLLAKANRISIDSSEGKKETHDDSEAGDDDGDESDMKVDVPAVALDCSDKSSLPVRDMTSKLPLNPVDSVGTPSSAIDMSVSTPQNARTLTGDKARTVFSCAQCSYETKFKSNLAKHISELHSEKGEKTVKCPLCDKLFNTECGMQKHLKILHSEERTFICQVCNKAFKTPNSLTLHSEVHNSDETYACNINGCSKTFRAKRMLTNHKKIEHGILLKRFDCRQPGCGQVFVKESHLRKHLAGAHAGLYMLHVI